MVGTRGGSKTVFRFYRLPFTSKNIQPRYGKDNPVKNRKSRREIMFNL